MPARVSLPDALEPLLKSEMERVIDEARLGTEGELIARRYFIERIPQIEIAVELGYERSTISAKLHRITIRLVYTAKKLNITKTPHNKHTGWQI